MRVWGLYSSRVDMYHPHELIDLFTDQAVAELVRDNLFGKQVDRRMIGWVWEDDEDFPDLSVRPLEIRPGVSR